MKRSVILDHRFIPELDEVFKGKQSWKSVAPKLGIPGFEPDLKCGPEKVLAPDPTLPRLHPAEEPFVFTLRGRIDADADASVFDHPHTVGVWSNPRITTHTGCSRDGDKDPDNRKRVGTYRRIKKLLCHNKLRQEGMDGQGVVIAIIDTGINLPYLDAKLGYRPKINKKLSHSCIRGAKPFRACVDHGTAMAFNALLVAPKATLVDFPIITDTRSRRFQGMLGDAAKIYRRLLDWMRRQREAGKEPRLVVNNSWGLKNPERDDYPIDAFGNYSHNRDHYFNERVTELAREGADLLFSAGNCGDDAAIKRTPYCSSRGPGTIYGANSHPQVLTVAAATANRCRIGVSSEGPGVFDDNEKPDICAYSHFLSSEVLGRDRPDIATSTACAVATSLVAAIRSKYSQTDLPPCRLRTLIRDSAHVQGTNGWDPNYGKGVIDVAKLLVTLPP